MPIIKNLIDNVALDDNIEYLNPFTDLIIYLFEIVPVDELQTLGIINSIFDKFMHNCKHKNLCAKALAGMSINFFESTQNCVNTFGLDLTPELIKQFNEDNEYLVYVYQKFSDVLLSLLTVPAEENKNYRKDATYALLHITDYANKKLKIVTHHFYESETLLKTKMDLINKIGMMFLTDEIVNDAKQDPFMIKYFYNIFMVNLKLESFLYFTNIFFFKGTF